MTSPRYTLFIKKNGTCPFSQRALMFLYLRVPDQFKVLEIDIQNKPKEFLELNPEGKVPVLIDHSVNNKVVSDSACIVKYVNEVSNNSDAADLACGYEGGAVLAGSGIFRAFAGLMKNKDPACDAQLKEKALAELKKFNDALENLGNSKFLLGDHLTEPDCMLLPRLNQIRAAGPKLKDLVIPDEYTGIWQYLEAAKSEKVWKETCPTDEHVCEGWAVHM